MLKLEPQSAILEEALGARLIDGKREACEVSCADFDDALFKLRRAARAGIGINFTSAKLRATTRYWSTAARDVWKRPLLDW